MEQKEARYDHREKGWFVEQVDGPEQAARVKAAVLEHLQGHFRGVEETGRETLSWDHDGTKYRAHVGEQLVFAGVGEGPVWAFLRTTDVLLVVTRYRGVLGDTGPILVGYHDIV